MTSFVVNYSSVVGDVPNAAEAVAMYGDNGPANGPDPEYTLNAPTSSASGRVDWGDTFNDDGSWTSTSTPVEMDVDLTAGTLTWMVYGGTPQTISLSGPSSGVITGVAVSVGTQINGSVTWSDLTIAFADASNNVDSSYSASGLSVDTTASDTGIGEQQEWASVTGNVTKATVSGMLQMTLPAGEYPNPADLFASVQVFTSSSAS